jgi:hypothetical protein
MDVGRCLVKCREKGERVMVGYGLERGGDDR